MKQSKNLDRRSFLKLLGVGGAAAVAACAGKKSSDASVDNYKNQVEPPTGQMTFRTNSNTGDQVSLLGYGMMRLPMKEGTAERRSLEPDLRRFRETGALSARILRLHR